jgi:hypothetical protein
LRRSEILASQRSKHQSQTGEVLSDVGQNESKIKRNNLPAGLDKVGGFIEAQGLPLEIPPSSGRMTGAKRLQIFNTVK